MALVRRVDSHIHASDGLRISAEVRDNSLLPRMRRRNSHMNHLLDVRGKGVISNREDHEVGVTKLSFLLIRLYWERAGGRLVSSSQVIHKQIPRLRL